MDNFSMELPDVLVEKKQVLKETAPTNVETKVISDMVTQQADMILHCDLDDFGQSHEITKTMETFGNDVIQKFESNNGILKQRLDQFSKAGGESVANSLEELSLKMKDLDPSGLDFSRGKVGRFFNPVRKYFERYKTADGEIADIVESLEKGKQTLQNDNVTLELEKNSMREATKELALKISLGEQMDAYLSNEIEKARVTPGNEERVKFVEEEVLFPLRQRVMDLQQIIAVNQQGIIAMEVIRKNNLELIRGVERAKVVTVTALRTAVTVAGALYNQKIVMQKIDLLNHATNDMITSTSRMLKEQGTAIQKQAMESSVSPDALKQAFADTIAALDDISAYKQKALPMMSETIATFKTLAEEGEAKIQKLEQK